MRGKKPGSLTITWTPGLSRMALTTNHLFSIFKGPVPSDDQVEPQTNEVVLVYYIKIVGLHVAETIVEPLVDPGRAGSIACLVMIRPASPGSSFRTTPIWEWKK